MRPVIHVGAGVIIEKGRFLVTRRPKGYPMEGKWEFPGGKKKAGESTEVCIRRELQEELGIDVKVKRPIVSLSFERGDVTILLEFCLCERVRGELEAREGQEFRWAALEEIADLDLLPADRRALERIIEEVTKDVQEEAGCGFS